jgi:hypothetical protein
MRNPAKVLTGTVLLSAILGISACNSTPKTAAGTESQAGNQQAANAPDGTSDTGATASSGGFLGRLISSSEPLTLPAGTVLHVVVDQNLSSSQNRSGDGFQASVSDPVVINGKTVVPRGARVRGRVIAANSSGRLDHPGVLRLGLRSVEVQGKSYELRTSSIERKGAGHEKRNVELIGGGAGVGALIGAVAGGGKGAAIGAVAGGGAGTAGAAATGKQDVTVPAETGLSFHLTAPLTISVKS